LSAREKKAAGLFLDNGGPVKGPLANLNFLGGILK